MMMRDRILRFLLILCAALAASGGFVRADFLADARNRVAHGEHESAIPYFEKHLQAAPPSAAAYFEFGQALAKVGKEAEAALAFRRTLILDPRFAPAETALRDANAQLGLTSPSRNWHNAVTSRIPLDDLAIGGAAAFWLGAFLFLAGLIAAKSRRALLSSSLVLILCGVAALVVLWLVDPRETDSRDAMILSTAGAVLYKTPSEDPSQKITSLGQGSVVKILSKRGRWGHGELPGGQRGWFLLEGTTPVIPAA
jgi:tetratricopeptide (TPR) repeat protein